MVTLPHHLFMVNNTSVVIVKNLKRQYGSITELQELYKNNEKKF